MEEPQHANAKSVIHGITSMVSPRYIQLSFAKLFGSSWLARSSAF